MYVSGGLKIPVMVTLSMDYSEHNQAKVLKIEVLFNDYYLEPVKGNFDDATNAILKTIRSDNEDELDDFTDHEEDNDAIQLLIIIRVLLYDYYYLRKFNLAFCMPFAKFAKFSTRNQ